MGRKTLIALSGAFLMSVLATPVLAADGKTAPVIPKDKNFPLSKVWSGYHFAKKETQAAQDDEFDNPGMLWFAEGEALWNKVDGAAGKSCASCHKDAAASMKGVALKYPAYFKPWKKLISLEQRINLCRTEKMKAKPFKKFDSKEMLGMMIYVKRQSHGMPINVKVTAENKPFWEAGKKFYYERRGMMDMSCAHCHEANYGTLIRMNTLSQGQSNGFPVFRLKWQKPGSIHRRFKGCNKQVRAKPFKIGSDVYNNLELYLAWRGNGLTVETPAVRN